MSVVEVPQLEQRTPEDWRVMLDARLEAQRSQLAEYESYYAGQHPMAYATVKFREAFGNLFRAFADNWCELIVDAAVERLEVIGFRFGDETEADNDAWALWQENSLDVESVIAHTEAGKCGRCYLLVDPKGDEDGPRITVETAQQVIVASDPGDRRRRLAALKKWAGDDGRWYATVYLPDTVVRWETSEAVAPGQEPDWVPRSDGGDMGAHGLGVVPMIPLANKPGLLNLGTSDLAQAIPLQNAINKMCSDMLVASEYGAFRQRVVIGAEIARDPETGVALKTPALESAMSRYWQFEDKDVKVTDLNQTDLQVFVNSIELFVHHMAAQTRTPPHYLIGEVFRSSGDALKAAEAGLVSKCRSKQLYYSDSWEEAIALAMQASGHSDVAQANCEVLWADPEKYTPSQLADAAVKKMAVGVPEEVLWSELGYTPERIEAMKAMNEAKAAEAPPAPPPPTDQPPPPEDPNTGEPVTTEGG